MTTLLVSRCDAISPFPESFKVRCSICNEMCWFSKSTQEFAAKIQIDTETLVPICLECMLQIVSADEA